MQNNHNSYIVVKNISHTYQDKNIVLDDINIDIKTGLFGLLGANGAGKSTLMRILSTLLVPTSGQVTIGGYDVVNDRQEVRKLLGYLPQEFGAWRLHTVEEVLGTLASLSGIHDKNKRQLRVSEVLELVGLGDVANRKVKSLSGGMLRRLGLAQALVHEPKVIILDEPTVGLDPEERLRFRQLMVELSRDRVIILSTHIMSDFGASCSDMLLIHEGKSLFKGSPTEFISFAQDRVLEFSVDAEKALDIECSEEIEIVNRFSRNGQVILRGVAKKGATFSHAEKASNITMEEAYLAFTMNENSQGAL